MSKAPAASDQKMVAYKAKDGQEVRLTIDMIRDFLVTGNKELVTIQEFMFFMGICRARGLNPFAKDCYLIKYTANDPAAIITAIDFYRARAKAQPDCHGWEKGVICLNKETGELRYSKGVVLPKEELVGGWFRAQPNGWTIPFELEVNLEGYIKKKQDGTVTKFWQKSNQPTMIAKVAESQGLRTLWPDEFRGTVTAEEAGLMLETFETLDVETLPGGGTSAPPAIDTSEFDKLLEGKNLDEGRNSLVQKFVEATAQRQKRKLASADEVKVRAAKNFDEFWKHFEVWEGSLPAAAPPEAPPSEVASGAGEPPGTAPGEESPDSAPEVIPFGDRQTKVWHDAVAKGIPPMTLAEVGVNKMADITLENIDAVEKLVSDYQPKRGRVK